jgi:hypothetical protein
MALVSENGYCAYSHFSAMLERTGHDWLIGMYESYWDDSGTDSSCPLAIAACYVSRKNGWDRFTDDLYRIGREEGFETFHMADFAAGAKPFDGWNEEKKSAVFRRLANAINANKQMGFGVAIPKEVFDRVVPTLPEPLRIKYGKHHYTFAVKVLLTLIGRWRVASLIKLPMRYVFDRMGKGKGEIMSIWDNDNLRGWDALGKLGMEPKGYSFEDKAEFKPLQAADVLAWQLNWHMRKVILAGRRDEEDCHPNFRLLRLDQGLELSFMTEENFMNTIKPDLVRLEKSNAQI